MTGARFDPTFDELPARLPVFPLTGVLLLPRGKLPLNIFEPRYLAMTLHALGHGRAIGMIQPQEGCGDAGDPPLYRTGCLGRITSFSETQDGRFLVTLTGVARFDVAHELDKQQGFRLVGADWRPYRRDLEEQEAALDRDHLCAALKPFFEQRGISADFDSIRSAPAERLVNTLAMVCPFAPREKQALLEAADTAERARLLVALVEMALKAPSTPVGGQRH